MDASSWHPARYVDSNEVFFQVYSTMLSTNEIVTIFHLFRLFRLRWHWDSSWLSENSLTYQAWRSVMYRLYLVGIVLRRWAIVDNLIPSSCFSKSISKSVAESSELFSEDSSFHPVLKLKILFMSWSLSVCNQAVHLEPSMSHAADINKKIRSSFSFKYCPLNNSTLWNCLSLKRKFKKP